MATTIPRSLKDPVGFIPSNLKKSAPTLTFFSRDVERMRGVFPSSRLMKGVEDVTGRYSAKYSRTPGQRKEETSLSFT
jgi:hypothetical protein